MSKDINDVRAALFDVMEGLKNKTLDIDRASAITSAAQALINSAKVENDYLKITGGSDSGFIQEKPKALANVTVHRIRG